MCFEQHSENVLYLGLHVLLIDMDPGDKYIKVTLTVHAHIHIQYMYVFC